MMSAVTPLVTDPPAAARAGADLRAARERLGLSLDDVALKLRIRLPHLVALEEGRIALLPGNAYALAFVRTYAKALGLDAEEMVRRFRTEAAQVGRRTELVFPVPMPERGFPAGASVLLGLVLVVGAYAGWYRLSGEGRLPAETVTAIPERLAPLADQTPQPPGPTGPSARVSGGEAFDNALSGTATTAFDTQADTVAPPVMMISPTSAAAAQLPAQSSGGQSSVGQSSVGPSSEGQSSVGPSSGGQSSVGLSSGNLASTGPAKGNIAVAALSALPALVPSAPPLLDAGRIVLRASASAWVMVKDRAGAVLLNRTMKAGEAWAVPPRSDLLLTTGNAGGTDILVDGAMTPSLGNPGTVRRDVPLDADQIKDGKLTGATAPQVAAGRTRQ